MLRIIRKTLSFLVVIVMMISTFVTVKAQTYTYDDLGRLVEVTYPSGTKTKYTYDSAGNIKSVSQAKLNNITIDLKSYNLTLNKSHNTRVYSIYSDGETVDITNDVVFKSSNSSVASVDDIGTVTGKKIGQAIITVSYAGKSVSSQVTVNTSDKIAPSVKSSNFTLHEIHIKFSENITMGSNFDNIVVQDKDGAVIKSNKFIRDNILTIKIIAAIDSLKEYKLTIPKESIKDLAGNTLVSDYVKNFIPAIDKVAPIVASTTPAKGATNITKSGSMNVVFSEVIQKGDKYSGIVLKDNTGKAISAITSIKDNVLTLKPSNDLMYNTTYILTIPKNAVKDLQGNFFLSDYKVSFTTEKAKIKSIANINVTVKQGDKYTLPSTVKAVMNDNTTQQVLITWNPKKADTSKSGKFTFQGTVQGYSKKVNFTLTVQQKQQQGNTNENILNGGKAVTDGNYHYYVGVKDRCSYGINKIKLDGTAVAQIYSNGHGSARDLNVFGKYLYYDTPFGIFRTNLNGENTISLQVNKDIFKDYRNMIVIDGWIYYGVVDTTHKINKMRIDGKENTTLTEGSDNFAVYNNCIYYINYKDNSSIYRMKSDGTNKIKINNKESRIMSIQNGWIYYSYLSEESCIYKVSLDGKQDIKIGDTKVKNAQVSRDWVYYCMYNNQKHNYSLHKMKLDGSKNVVLFTGKTEIIDINVVNDWIYFSDTIDIKTNFGGGLYRIKADGTNLKVLASPH